MNLVLRNWTFFKLGIISNLEYRFNFIVDAVVQPATTAFVDVFLWFSMFIVLKTNSLNGFSRESYLAYVLWGSFISRVSTNWMYEHMMMDDIESGSLNSLLLRPTSFFEYYLSQFLGYKFITFFISAFAPILLIKLLTLPTDFSKLPITIILIFYYLIFIFTLSFCTACLGFFLNRVRSFTIAKNFLIYTLSGELFPLDLLSEKWKNLTLKLPFSCGVYVPVGYLTGRIDIAHVWNGLVSITIGLLLSITLAYYLWRKGLRRYSGTGA